MEGDGGSPDVLYETFFILCDGNFVIAGQGGEGGEVGVSMGSGGGRGSEGVEGVRRLSGSAVEGRG